MQFHVISAVFKRNISSFFTSVLGYLFIVAFVAASGCLAFSERFFVANEPSLDQLTAYFPLLLLFIIPAVTMSTWADEEKLGTDELLFTLPATDFEILMGKYLSVMAIYTVTLLFAAVNCVALRLLGNPDPGVLITTFFGYWVMGSALIAGGMLASSLTSNTTVAFVLGAALCMVLVYTGQFLAVIFGFFGATNIAASCRALSFDGQAAGFGLGVIPLSSVLFFAALSAVLLYLNYIQISRRHWKNSRKGDMGVQFSLRTICLTVTLFCACFLASKTGFSFDLSSEGLYTLTPTTKKILSELKTPVVIEAYVSPEMPEEYVQTEKQLAGLLRQYDRLGNKVTTRMQVVEQFSEEAESARQLGLESVRVMTNRNGRRTEEEIFLGVVVRSNAESSNKEIVVPFIGNGLPLEYELTRSVRTVAREERLTVGVLTTDAQVMTDSSEWQIVTELKKQYDVVSVSPDSEIDQGKIDVLLAVMPSSLTEPQNVNFINYVKAGKPTLVFDDPVPLSANRGVLELAPKLPKPSPGGGMMGMRQPPPPQKADGGQLTTLTRMLGITWDNGESVFDLSDTPAEYGPLPKQFVFVNASNGNKDAFNEESEVTKGLQQVVALVSGEIRFLESRKDIEFTPLLQTGAASGSLEWKEYIRESMNPFQMRPMAQFSPPSNLPVDKYAHILAGHVKSDKDAGLNCIFVADIDVIGDFFFREWSLPSSPVRFDNVTFVLNAIDVLAEEDSYIPLRRRRETRRSLARIEVETREVLTKSKKEEQAAEEALEKELKTRQDALNKRVEEIKKDKTLDERSKSRLVDDETSNQQRLLDVFKANKTLEKDRKIQQINARSQREVRAIENKHRLLAILGPPLVPILVGIIVLLLRVSREQSAIVSSRRRTK